MKRVRIISTAFEEGKSELTIETPLVYKDYVIDLALYNNSNTPSRVASLHPRMKCKVYKMMDWLEHPDYDYYIWINAKFTILDGFFENIFAFEDDDAELFLFNHPQRSSIRSEMDFMTEYMKMGNPYVLRRYTGDIMEEQVTKILADHSFIDDQLFDGGLFMFKKKLVENKDHNLMLDWLLYNTMYSVQDQLWFPYLIQKYKVKYKVYDHHLYKNNFLRHSG